MRETEMMTTAQAAEQIRKAYGTYRTQYRPQQGDSVYMSTVEIHNRCDLTTEQITDAVQHLNRTERNFAVIPESNQKVLTQDERKLALWLGNQWKHYIIWD